MTIDEVINLLEAVLQADLDECILRGFERLDIRGEKQLSLQYIKQALLHFCKYQHTQASEIKTIFQRVLKYMNEDENSSKYGWSEFHLCLLSCLSPPKRPQNTIV